MRPNRLGRANLTESAVRRIRLRLAQREDARALADAYDVSVRTIRSIGSRESWRWVTEEGEGASAQEWEQARAQVPTRSEQDAIEESQARMLKQLEEGKQ